MNFPMKPAAHLRAFPMQLHALLLAARAKQGAAILPVCGETYELLLLMGDRILSAPNEQKRTQSGRTLSEAFGLALEDAALVRAYLKVPSHELLAVALPDGERLLMVLPVPGLKDGEGVAFLPTVSSQSLARVLYHSFAGKVRLSESARVLAERSVCADDENTYVYLRHLFSAWRWLMHGECIRIENRRALSHHMYITGTMIFSLLGLPAERMVCSAFPIPYPFCGSYHPARAAWLLLCLCSGLYRCLAHALPTLVNVPDNERLLPMIELHAGNRTPLPPEWVACGKMAAQYGMLFEVTRTRSTLRVVLCPLTPDISPAAFYAFRAPASLLWQLRSSLPPLS